jgi:hypothetical protein
MMDAKSSHCFWQGELKRQNEGLRSFPQVTVRNPQASINTEMISLKF